MPTDGPVPPVSVEYDSIATRAEPSNAAPDAIDAADPWAAYEGRLGGSLLALSAEDGKIQAEYQLTAPPVLDGLAASRGRLLLSTIGGKIVCYEGESRRDEHPQ